MSTIVDAVKEILASEEGLLWLHNHGMMHGQLTLQDVRGGFSSSRPTRVSSVLGVDLTQAQQDVYEQGFNEGKRDPEIQTVQIASTVSQDSSTLDIDDI